MPPDQLVPKHGAGGGAVGNEVQRVVPDQTGRFTEPEHDPGGLVHGRHVVVHRSVPAPCTHRQRPAQADGRIAPGPEPVVRAGQRGEELPHLVCAGCEPTVVDVADHESLFRWWFVAKGW